VARVARTKEQLAAKGALHLIHGRDVARAVVGVVKADLQRIPREERALFGKRWIVADCVSYDWWSLVWEWMGESGNDTQGGDEAKVEDKVNYRRWVFELMEENKVRCLPRSPDALGRKLDARDFWQAIGLVPERSLAR